MIHHRHTHPLLLPPSFTHQSWETPPHPLLRGTSPVPLFLRPALICRTSAAFSAPPRRRSPVGLPSHTLRRFIPSWTTGMRNQQLPTFSWAPSASADANTPPSIGAHSGPLTSPGGAGPPSYSPEGHRHPSHPTCTEAPRPLPMGDTGSYYGLTPNPASSPPTRPSPHPRPTPPNPSHGALAMA